MMEALGRPPWWSENLPQTLVDGLLFISTVLLGYAMSRAAKLFAAALRKNQAPPKRVYRSHHLDSTIWDEFTARDDDVFVVTSYKAGSTFVQRILAQLILPGDEALTTIPETSPWLEHAANKQTDLLVRLQHQSHRRFIKTRLPANAIPFYDKCRYIVVGRSGLDIFMDIADHLATRSEAFFEHVNENPNRTGPPLPKVSEMTPAMLFERWIAEGWETHPWESDGWPFSSVFDNVASWWRMRPLKNGAYALDTGPAAGGALICTPRSALRPLQLPPGGSAARDAPHRGLFGYPHRRGIVPGAGATLLNPTRR